VASFSLLFQPPYSIPRDGLSSRAYYKCFSAVLTMSRLGRTVGGEARPSHLDIVVDPGKSRSNIIEDHLPSGVRNTARQAAT
jgi:hypothetical protein